MNTYEFLKTPGDVKILRTILETVTTADLGTDNFGKALNFDSKHLKRCPQCDTMVNPTDKVCRDCGKELEESIKTESANIIDSITVNLGISLISREEAESKRSYPINNYTDILAALDFDKSDLVFNGVIARNTIDSIDIAFLFTDSEENTDYYYPALGLGISGYPGDLFRSLLLAAGITNADEIIQTLRAEGQFRINYDGNTVKTA